MKTRYILYSLLTLMAILLPTSCSTEEDFMDSSITSNGDKVTLTLGVSVPGATNVASRAFIDGDNDVTDFDADYYNFENLFVAVFEQAEDKNYYYQGTTEVSPQGTATHDGKTCSTYNVTLTATNKPCRLHIIANYPDLSMGFDDEGESIGRLKTKVDDLSHDVYWNFVDLPNGIKTETKDGQTVIVEAVKQKLQHVPLVRNYAKVQLELADDLPDTFEFLGYKLYNMPTVGTVAAYNPNATNKFVNFVGQDYEALATANYLGNEPYQVGLDNADEWTTAPTYMYERKNTDSNGQLLANAAYIIVKGELNGTTYYYKLDFVDNGGNPYNLLRNFVYTMTVAGVNGPGYATEAEAMAQPAGNNLNASAAIKDFTNISNGTQQLFVSTTSLMITQEKDYYLYYKYISNLTSGTTSNSSVTITGDDPGNVLEVKASNSNSGGTGEYAGWGKVTLTPKKPGAYTTQVLTFTAGSLQRTVTLTAQQPSSEMSVSLDPTSVAMQSEQDVAVNISLPAALGDSESLFPLRMFIYSKDNTIYATNLPVEIRDGKYGFIREITLEEFETTKTVDGKKVFSSAFKTNCENSATTIYVEHDYFNRASADLGNVWQNSVTLSTDIAVDIEQVYGRYPQTIYGNGTNNGTKTGVKVIYKGTYLTETISIDKDNVTSGIDFVSVLSRANINGTLSKNDVVVFEFTDKHWRGGNNWSDNIIYRAETTMGRIADGTTLEFNVDDESIQKITMITIPQGLNVKVQQDGTSNRYYYPLNIYNNGANNGLENVTVNYKSQSEIITINATSVIYNDDSDVVSFTNNDGFELEDELTFTFDDQYCVGTSGSGNNRKPTWSTNKGQVLKDTYTAKCRVEDLLNSEYTLDFKR